MAEISFHRFFQAGLHVIHEGVDYQQLSLLKKSKINYPTYLPDSPNIEVLTYVSRCFESYRGFPQIIELISKLQSQRPNLHVVLVGQDGSAYGPPRSDGIPWSIWAKNTFHLDPSRTHWVGPLQTIEYRNVLAISDVHVYLTVPFILSWSLLEAMAAGCAIVASNTPPVREVLEDDFSALLVDFFDVDSQLTAVSRLLDDKRLSKSLASQAQKTAQRYSLEVGLEKWHSLIC